MGLLQQIFPIHPARQLTCSDLREERRVAVKELHFARLGDWKFLELFERSLSRGVIAK